MIYADAHCHLDFDEFGCDRHDLMVNCQNLGIRVLVIPGVDRDNWKRVLEISAQYKNVYPCVGLHPCFLDRHQEDDIAALERVLQSHEEIVAVGETGLDLTVEGVDRQLSIFEKQIDLANRFKLPVVMHSRKAHNLILQLLKRKPLVSGGLLHGFSGSYEQAMDFWKSGVYLGLGGVITYDRARKTRNTFAKLPLESIVLETDSPDMPLQGKQGDRNTPLNIPLIHKAFCSLRSEREEDINRQLMKNTSNLFGISKC